MGLLDDAYATRVVKEASAGQRIARQLANRSAILVER
jgi:hypothetical protein